MAIFVREYSTKMTAVEWRSTGVEWFHPSTQEKDMSNTKQSYRADRARRAARHYVHQTREQEILDEKLAWIRDEWMYQCMKVSLQDSLPDTLIEGD